jgi:hypothetical protein
VERFTLASTLLWSFPFSLGRFKVAGLVVVAGVPHREKVVALQVGLALVVVLLQAEAQVETEVEEHLPAVMAESEERPTPTQGTNSRRYPS